MAIISRKCSNKAGAFKNVRICPKCGNEVEIRDQKCSQCGNILSLTSD
ncbi:zinc-ribbon domain-containing protein [Thermoproteota archaeon]